jgi:hypothetical protein
MIKKRTQKKDSNKSGLTRHTRDPCHEMRITS